MDNIDNNSEKYSKVDSVAIEKILFDTMYQKKIGIKDWFFTKLGVATLLSTVYLAITNSLDVQKIIFITFIILVSLQRTTILAYTKDINIWGKIIINKLLVLISEIKPFRDTTRRKKIIEICEIK